MREFKAIGAFARGAESFGHFLAMLRVSVARTILGCTALAVIVAGASMALEFTEAERRLLPTYVATSVQARLMPNGSRRIQQWRGTNVETVGRLRATFGGRSVSFMAKQLVLRAAAGVVVLLPACVVLLTLLGRILSAHRHLRGARIVDTTTWAYRHRGQMNRAALGVLGAVLVSTAVVGTVSWPHGPVAVLALAKSWCAVSSSVFANLISNDAGLIWHPTVGSRAMMSPADSYAVLAESFGVGLPALASAWALGALVGGGGVALAVGKVQKRGADESGQSLLHLAGIPIDRKRETQHFAFVGDIGSGKSVAMTPPLHTIRQRLQRAIVWQYKMEYLREFFRPGYDVILNPLDLRGAVWTPWAEIRTQADYLTLGKSLFPVSVHREEFWSIAGASLFGSLTERMLARGRPYNKELAYELTHASLEEMRDSVRGTMGQRYLDEHAAQMSASLLATLTSQLEAFRFLRDVGADENVFSIKDFVAEDSDRWLFVSMSAEQEAIRPLVSLWLDTALRASLSLPDNDKALPDEKQRRLFVILDEMPALQVLPSLVQSLASGRSKGLSVLLGIQSFEQVQATYGVHLAKATLGQAQTKLFTRTTEGETARWIKEQLGSAEVEQSHESQQMGASTQRDGVSVQRSTSQRELVLTSEIQTLPDLTGYLRTVDEHLLKVSYTWTPGRDDPQEEFVPAAEPEPPRAPPWAQARKELIRAQQLAGRGDAVAAYDAARLVLSIGADEVVTHAAETLVEQLRKEGFEPLLARSAKAERSGDLPRAIKDAEGALRLCDDDDSERLETAWKVVQRLRAALPRWERAQRCLSDSRDYFAAGDVAAARGAAKQARALLGETPLQGLGAWEQELQGHDRGRTMPAQSAVQSSGNARATAVETVDDSASSQGIVQQAAVELYADGTRGAEAREASCSEDEEGLMDFMRRRSA